MVNAVIRLDARSVTEAWSVHFLDKSDCVGHDRLLAVESADKNFGIFGTADEILEFTSRITIALLNWTLLDSKTSGTSGNLDTLREAQADVRKVNRSGSSEPGRRGSDTGEYPGSGSTG